MSNGEKKVSEEALQEGGRVIARQLREAGHQAWFVGGCVRDQLLKRPLKDIDITTDAKPEEIEELFEKTRIVGKKFAVILVRTNHADFEVATFRKDGVYLNHRHPDHVSYGTMEEDSVRRDFTVNALYMDPFDLSIRDFHTGLQDLEKKILRAVGDPHTRFQEDALRLLRSIRFATRLGFTIEEHTWSAICDLAPTIQYISPERQRDELTGIFSGPEPGRGLQMLSQSGLLDFLLPEIQVMHGVEQGKTFHPEGDVFAHTCLVLEKLEPRTTITAWAALLHDVGKPPTFERDSESGKITFYEHQSVGAEMAKKIMGRFRFSNDEIQAVSAIVARHMTFMNVEKMKKSTLRKFLGAPTIEGDLAVHRADVLGSCGLMGHYEFCVEQLEVYRQNEENALPPPFLNGRDVIGAGVKPGPEVGRVLREAMELQLEEVLQSREEALDWLKSVT